MTPQEFLQQMGEEKVKAILTDLLNECLGSANQEHSFKVVMTDLAAQKFMVEFNIVAVPEDQCICFQGY